MLTVNKLIFNVFDALAIWYHLYNLKDVKKTRGGVLILLHSCFSRFLNSANGTKSRKASHI